MVDSKNGYPDSASYSGALAMTLVPDANGIGVGDAVAEVEVDIQYIPSLLTFYSKWDFVVGQGGLTVTFYNGEAVVLTETWTPDQTQPNSDWQFIQMSLPQIEPIITHAVIRCWAQVGDLASASISFDEMEWDVVNGLNELAEDSFSLSPNPCNNHLNIVTKEAFDPNMTITIYDALGREVYFGSNTNQLSVQSLNNGQYFLRMTSDSKLITKRFMVKR